MAQLWLAEDGVRADDTVSTLVRHDVVQRTNAETRGTRQSCVIAGSGARTPALPKLVDGTPGVYRFSQKTMPSRLTNGASAYWQLLCITNAALSPIWQRDIDIATVHVSADCAIQHLEYIIAGI